MDAPSFEALSAKVDEMFAPWDRPDVPGCAVGIVRDGELVYCGGFGTAHLAYEAPNTPQTAFDLASFSKSFTSVCLALLMDEGKIDPDDELRKFIPEMHAFDPPIRVRHMLQCRTGLWDPWHVLPLIGWGNEPLQSAFSKDDVLTVLFGQQALPFAPGTEFQYSSGDWMLLGLIVERISGQSLAEFAKSRVFEPLGMTRTFIEEDPSRAVRGRAIGHWKDQGDWRLWTSQGYGAGGGGVQTCVEDLVRWDRNFDDNRLPRGRYFDEFLRDGMLLGNRYTLDADAFRKEAQPDVPNPPAGQYRGLKRVQFTGGLWGGTAAMARYPEQRWTFICLSNSGEVNAIGKVRELADLCLADQLEPLPATVPDDAGPLPELSESALAELAGAYSSGGTNPVWRIEVRDGTLRLVDHLRAAFRLEPLTPTRFRAAGDAPFYPSARFEFERPTPGEPPVMTLSSHEHGFREVIPFRRVALVDPGPDELADYAGEYVSEELAATYRFRVQDGALWLRVGSRRWERLDPTRVDTFVPHVRTGFDNRILTFRRDERGRVAGLSAALWRVRGVEFVKR
jgi:CubicO group peptidase (beta-lactamase class C family)